MYISGTLSILVDFGEFGRYIKIKRDQKWICLSSSLWDLVHAQPLTNLGQIVHLTKEKYVELIEFNGRRYVSFVQVCSYQGNEYKHYINFNDLEWSRLLNKLPEIKKQLKCKLCKRSQIQVLQSGRIKLTKLTNEQYKRVILANAQVQNQMGLACTYCGVEGCLDGCHCHRYDCNVCEPDNFCRECGALMLKAAPPPQCI
jgi:hypothetical protein